MNLLCRLTVASAFFALLPTVQAFGQEFGIGSMDRSSHLSFEGGAQIYYGVCQGCHMKDASGARGAGVYPALSHNAKLAESGYPISVILHGQKAMPALGGMFSDQQIAEVINYVRQNFGNSYRDVVTPANVKAAR